jgi:transcriptional regulator NrdR family protein
MPKSKRKRQTCDCRGLACRECGCQRWEVLETRRRSNGTIRRRRRCRACGRRISTQEREVFDKRLEM